MVSNIILFWYKSAISSRVFRYPIRLISGLILPIWPTLLILILKTIGWCQNRYRDFKPWLKAINGHLKQCPTPKRSSFYPIHNILHPSLFNQMLHKRSGHFQSSHDCGSKVLPWHMPGDQMCKRFQDIQRILIRETSWIKSSQSKQNSHINLGLAALSQEQSPCHSK